MKDTSGAARLPAESFQTEDEASSKVDKAGDRACQQHVGNTERKSEDKGMDMVPPSSGAGEMSIHSETRSFAPPPPRTGASGASKTASSTDYAPPTWAAETPPESQLSLTVLKGGVEVTNVSLKNKTRFLLGRQQGVVDILLEHPSISRQHAVLQYNDKGEVFLFDNGSTHGCAVNKKRVASKVYRKLNVGDVIKFGESTRLYVLEGPVDMLPAEYESENLRNLRLEAAKKQVALKILKVQEDGEATRRGTGDGGEFGISWGFDEDAVAEDDDDNEDEKFDGVDGEVELPEYLKTEAQKRRRKDTRLGLTMDSVHKRDAKLFEKLQAKLAKVEHLLTENERIAAKEGGQGGLTEGQQAQLARNDKAIEGIRLQIEELEDTIRSKNKARAQGKGDVDSNESLVGGGKQRGEDGGSDDDDDEFYDRTAPMKKSTVKSLAGDGGNEADKRAEVIARRFGPQKREKAVLVFGSHAAGASTARLREGGGEDEDSPAQNLEALLRRREIVDKDLEVSKAGLEEVEAEEAEEALQRIENDGEGHSIADPLDAFMTSNRRNARQQARSRLLAQLESLEGEKLRLAAMIEAASPSLPQLKTKVTESKHDVSKNSDASSDSPAVPKVVHSTEANAMGKDKAALKRAPASARGQTKPDEQSETRTEGGDSIGPNTKGSNAAEGKLRVESHHQEPPEPETFTAVSVPSNRQINRSHVDVTARARSDGGGDDRALNQGPRSGVVSDGVGGLKRKAPVGPSMLPPPSVVKAPTNTSSSIAEVGGRSGGGEHAADERMNSSTMLSPSMPPPPSKKHAATGVRLPERSSGPTSIKADDVLEGGDKDWVPPKGQAGDGRTALNAKFGY